MLNRARALLNAGRPLARLPTRRTMSSNRRSSGPSAMSNTTTVLLASLASSILGFGLAKVSLPPTPSPPIPPKQPAPRFGTSHDFQLAIADLHTVFASHPGPPKVSTDQHELHAHGFSAHEHHVGASYNVVVYPECTEDVVEIVKIATRFRMPITPYSGATSLEGQYHAHPVGGICVDMNRMDRIIEIHAEDSDLVCQPGVKWMDINETLKEKGIPLFFPIDPAPGATIGGMLSTGCSGTNAVRYGTSKGEWFLNATVVLPSGEVIKTRQRSRKSSAGFDVTKLFIGAEGTLGIVTEVTIRLAPLLPTTVAVAQFPNVWKAAAAVSDAINTGVGIQCVELVDDIFVSAINKLGVSKRKYAVKDSLWFKFQGPTPASLAETAKIVREIVEKHGGESFELARSDEEAEELWADRKNAHYYGLAIREGASGWPTDVCVPVSKLPQLIYDTKADIASSGLVSTIVGHVGDGNFHALILFDPSSASEITRAKALVKRMVHRAIDLEGTCTGEHGVGVGKREYLVKELGEGTVGLMKRIKREVDPLGLFNPGKLYPDDSEHQDAKEER